MRVVGFDFGATLGVAIIEDERLLFKASIKLPNGSPGERFTAWQKTLQKYCLNGDIVAYERVDFHRGTKAAHAYGGYLAIFQAFCHQRNLVSYSVPVKTLKEHATGAGGSVKIEMVQAANKKYGLNLKLKDNNTADAIWVADWCLNKIRE